MSNKHLAIVIAGAAALLFMMWLANYHLVAFITLIVLAIIGAVAWALRDEILDRIVGPRKDFFIADTHFSNTGITCRSRGFNSADEMNETLIRFWNKTVSSRDTVYVIGDFAEGCHPEEWRRKLNRKLVLIAGNHDKGQWKRSYEYMDVTVNNIPILLVHNPDYTPGNWSGWVMHGHWHDSPFIDRSRRMICASIEAIGLRPISAEQLSEAIRGGLGCSGTIVQRFNV